MKVTVERLKELLLYDPETGVFKWLAFRTRKPPGSVAGTLQKKSGSIAIRLDGRFYLAHRLAWLYMTGSWPDRQVDHRDVNPANNAWDNLRLATPRQNLANRPVFKKAKSGFKGVEACGSRFRARIMIDGKNKHLGLFDTKEQAAAAYTAASVELYGDFAHIG